jgi:DNA-binding beta-propeller fold protein YncE
LATGVAASGQSAPAVVDAPGYHIVDRIPLTDGWWDNVVVEPANRMLFIARGNGISRIELDRGLIDYRFIPGLEGRAVTPMGDGGMMITTVSGYSSVILFSTVEGKVAKLIQLDQAADGVAYDPVTKTAWAMGVRGKVSIIDPEKLAVTGTLDLGESLESATSDGRGRIYTAASDSGSVIAFDARTRKIAGKWKLNDCVAPSSIAYVPQSDLILAGCFNNKLKVLDARSGKELATLPIGKGAEAVIYDPATRRAFVPSAYDGLLTVIQVDGPANVRVLETVRTQIGTRTGAIDSKTGALYLPTGRMGPIHKLGWPEAIPGTVELLVLKPR